MEEENHRSEEAQGLENEENSSSFKGRILWIIFFAVLIALAIACIIVIKVLD